MPNNNTNIEKLPGVIVEDITDLVNDYHTGCGINPITRAPFTHEQITRIMCKHTKFAWNNTGYFQTMTIYLLEDIISDLRLDAIQQTNSIREIATICRDTGV